MHEKKQHFKSYEKANNFDRFSRKSLVRSILLAFRKVQLSLILNISIKTSPPDFSYPKSEIEFLQLQEMHKIDLLDDIASLTFS